MKPQKESFDLSIVIVSYNTREVLRACLASLAASETKGDRWEVIVVDNASNDGSPEEVSAKGGPAYGWKSQNLTLIQNEKNVGFAAANNQGIRASRGRYILLLNSDTEMTPGTLGELKGYMDANRDVGAITCRVNLADGSLDPACHRGFPTPWASFTYFMGFEKMFGTSRLFGQYHQGFRSLKDIHDVDCISGAFFLVRRSVIDQIGLFDEKFFMYGEDIDWCFRIRASNHRIVFYPAVSIIHKKHQSGLGHPDAQTRRRTKQYFYDAMKLFYSKHYRHRYGFLVYSFILIGIKLRSLL
ncbi:MAG: glycosyltransferase family 2 protein [Patescibacteria group bacterium]|mgnify:CR=1 FL=1